MNAQVITLASAVSIPEGAIVAFDDDDDTPVIVTYTASQAANDAVVVNVAAAAFSGERPVVSGARNENVALASLISALAELGFITDATT